MPCSSGSLVIFPSWLDHHTLENKTDKRVTVSFNTVRKSVVLEKFPNSVKEAQKRLKVK
jgi:ectoine hydroxylase-related dioxygenase (phytanoyl-CoA dioxygenase family)